MDMTPHKFQSFKDLESALLDFKDSKGLFILIAPDIMGEENEDAEPIGGETEPGEEKPGQLEEDMPQYVPPDEEPS